MLSGTRREFPGVAKSGDWQVRRGFSGAIVRRSESSTKYADHRRRLESATNYADHRRRLGLWMKDAWGLHERRQGALYTALGRRAQVVYSERRAEPSGVGDESAERRSTAAPNAVGGSHRSSMAPSAAGPS